MFFDVLKNNFNSTGFLFDNLRYDCFSALLLSMVFCLIIFMFKKEDKKLFISFVFFKVLVLMFFLPYYYSYLQSDANNYYLSGVNYFSLKTFGEMFYELINRVALPMSGEFNNGSFRQANKVPPYRIFFYDGTVDDVIAELVKKEYSIG